MAVELDARAFKALSSPTRVSLLKKLAAKPRSLSSLAEEEGLSVQATDEHMHKLVQAGLVEKEKKSKWAYYRLTPAGRSLVAPDRQPVYLMLAVSVMLLLAAAITWPQANAPAAVGVKDAVAPQFTQSQPQDAQPLEASAKSAIITGDANASAPATADAGSPMEPVLTRAATEPVQMPSAAEPAKADWAALFGIGGLLAFLGAAYFWQKQRA